MEGPLGGEVSGTPPGGHGFSAKSWRGKERKAEGEKITCRGSGYTEYSSSGKLKAKVTEQDQQEYYEYLKMLSNQGSKAIWKSQAEFHQVQT